MNKERLEEIKQRVKDWKEYNPKWKDCCQKHTGEPSFNCDCGIVWMTHPDGGHGPDGGYGVLGDEAYPGEPDFDDLKMLEDCVKRIAELEEKLQTRNETGTYEKVYDNSILIQRTDTPFKLFPDKGEPMVCPECDSLDDNCEYCGEGLGEALFDHHPGDSQ
jgi:hypothetical protein